MLRKPSIPNSYPINAGGVLCLTAAIYWIYYLLLHNKALQIGILTILSCGHATRWNILAVGLVPIYLACIIFGIALLSVQLGTALQYWLLKRWHQ